MNADEIIKKLSRLVYTSDKDFIVEWSNTRSRGMLRFIIKNTIIMTVLMGIIGIFFRLNNHSMYGFKQSQTIFVALSMGFIMGIILSCMHWIFGNDRFNNLRDKKS